MTSNLVNFTSCSTSGSSASEASEVNNNNDKFTLETSLSSSKDDEHNEEPTIQPSHSVYTLNDDRRILVSSPEEWLCVARLPLDFTQTEFESLLQDFGPLHTCFLIHSEISGTSKGYGLVKYESKASSIQARHVLEGHQVRDGHILDCDWLKHNRSPQAGSNPAPPTVTSLHSKCLYVDQLPPDYRDMAQFRRLFSKIVNPPYCQIAIKNGMIHNWGLVEFQSSGEAEATMQALQGETIEGQGIRVQFCIPGVHAINIYMAFVNNPMDAVQEKKALLENTPSSKVYDQLNSLAKQNPWFVANLQNIMASSAFNSSNNNTHPPGVIQPLKTNQTDAADPAQAALILLLAGKVSQGSKDQNNALFNGIVKQMSNGINATEILRSIIKPQQPHEDLIQAAINMAGVVEDTKMKASKASPTPPSPPISQQQPKSDKCPLLTELLYKSFQARLAKEQRMKALKEQESSHTSHQSNAATAAFNAAAAAQMVVNASQQQLTTNVAATASVSSEAVSAAYNFLGANPNPMSHVSHQEMLHQPQQPQLSSYPHLLYYSQMMAPAAAAASMWPQYPGGTLLPTPAQATQPSTSHQSLMIHPSMMHLANGGAHVQGIKRTAPPVMYANIEKRMKLA